MNCDVSWLTVMCRASGVRVVVLSPPALAEPKGCCSKNAASATANTTRVRRKIVVFMSAETGSGRGSFVNARHGTAAPADMVTHCLTERSRQAFGHVLPAYDARPVNAVGHLGHVQTGKAARVDE